MRERAGKPQYIAGTLLLVFLAQCLWLVSRSLRAGEMDVATPGLIAALKANVLEQLAIDQPNYRHEGLARGG